MKRALMCSFAALLAGVAESVLAFDACNAIGDDAARLNREIRQGVIARSPARHHELSLRVRLVATGAGDSLIPFAGEQQGAPYVVLTPLFAKVACQIALARFLGIKGIQPDTIAQVGSAAGRCLDVGGSQKACLTAFAGELARRYAKDFAALPVGEQRIAFDIYRSTLNQIVMHEYAHHFLDHFSRIAAQKLGRIDAEFEADLFAITNGAQFGEPVSALSYFFSTLAEVERSATKWSAPQYESAACRASNVESVTGYVGIVPMLLADAASGGGIYFSRNSPATTRALAGKEFGRAAPSLSPGSCNHIAQVALGSARQELQRLQQRLDKDLELLFSNQKIADADRASRLVHDLADLSKGFQYMGGFAAKSAALMLRQWGLKGRELAPLMAEIDRLIDTPGSSGNFLSEDLGRMLQAQGFAVLQERVDLAPPVRLDRSYALLQRAVDYNPAQSEAWMNLAIIAFKRGDCALASRFGERAVATHTGKSTDDVKGFTDTMKQLVGNPDACRRHGAQFRPYPGF